MTIQSNSRRSSRTLSLRASLFGACALTALACGGSGEESEFVAEAPVAPALTAEGTASNLPAVVDAGVEDDSGLITDRADLSQAVIRVVASGATVEPGEQFAQGVSGSGTGFIIGSNGLAVTNNHVVTGAAILQVYVGESTEPVNARIVGVSECNDLAVIDLAGDGYRYLAWSDEPPARALDVLSVGYPLGDPSLTETEGILSKEEGPQRTSFAAADLVLEHTARILPGNSGGPLLSVDDLSVVGVNFAGSRENDINLALSVNLARDVVEQMQESGDLESVGVNGIAVSDGQGVTGVWVRSVKAGSPADTTGVKAGDILMSVGGLPPAPDGTLGNYCDVIRTQGSDATVDIELLRFSTGQTFEGQLNGRPLVETTPAALVEEEQTTTTEPPADESESTPEDEPESAPEDETESTPAEEPEERPAPTNVDWLIFSDSESEQSCDLINGAGFQVVIQSPSREVLVVSAGVDVPDELTGIFIDEAGNLLSDDGIPFARVAFATDADGNRRAWTVLIDGSVLGAEEGAELRFPGQFENVACNACGLVDSPAPGICE